MISLSTAFEFKKKIININYLIKTRQITIIFITN